MFQASGKCLLSVWRPDTLVRVGSGNVFLIAGECPGFLWASSRTMKYDIIVGIVSYISQEQAETASLLQLPF